MSVHVYRARRAESMAEALVYSAHDLATCLTKIEAYTRAEADAGE